ncbi:MAG: hypothetical protein AVDCRST_MAG25-2398, partial [uncultured Rubrobacteraceae bacterium]
DRPRLGACLGGRRRGVRRVVHGLRDRLQLRRVLRADLGRVRHRAVGVGG